MATQVERDRQLALELHEQELRSIGKLYEPAEHDLEEDRLLAERLQREQLAEYESEPDLKAGPSEPRQGNEKYRELLAEHKKLSLVDPVWETIDPTPDIHTLFQPRAGFCSIRLSKPLLSLRPRSDLVETLLHEMIHALLFLTQRNRDRDGHGPEFHKHMYRINKAAGTNISVYHSFHDEVRHFKVHHWRCSGPCKDRPPYFGWVKRSMNRAPGKNDFWWAEHERNCGGAYVKVSGPEKLEKPPKNKRSRDGSPTSAEGVSPLRKFFKSADTRPEAGASGSRNLGGKSFPSKRPISSGAQTSAGSPRSNIHGLATLTGSRTGPAASRAVTSKGPEGSRQSPRKATGNRLVPFQGVGHVLGGAPSARPTSALVNRLLQPTIQETLQRSKNSPTTSKQKLKGLALLDIFSSDEDEQNPQVDKKPPPSEASTSRQQQKQERDTRAATVPEDVDPKVICPICSSEVPHSAINSHIDNCLSPC